MQLDEWWKNFGMGLEIDASGTFIYNGIKLLEDLETLNHPIDIFEILYNLSVGLERLSKITIVLLEHNRSISIEEFEKSLITHNTQQLFERINSNRPLKLANIHREFLSLLSKFYITHRYQRYTLAAAPAIEEEKVLFLTFVKKHLKLDFDIEEGLFPIPNTDQIRKFIGKIVKKLSKELFELIKEKADELNLYTYELRGDSKALKVFYGERLDFIDERQIKKEIILFLMDQKNEGPHLNMLRSFGSLDIDESMAPYYIKALLYDSAIPYIEDNISEIFSELEDIPTRLSMLEAMDNEYASTDPEEDNFEVKNDSDDTEEKF